MLYLIRHGQTAQNQAKILQGRSDYPLNEAGLAQAKEAGRKFYENGISFQHIFSSPLQRAVRTAQLAAGECTRILLDERLIEMNYGPYEGMSLVTPPPEVLEFFHDFVHAPVPEGMEPLESVVARMGSFLEEIRMHAEKENVLISTHAIAMKGALEYLTPDSNGAYWSKHIRNCAIYAIPCEHGAFGLPFSY